MNDTTKHRWAVLGSVHLDLLCHVPEDFLSTDADVQILVDWRVDAGGVASNIARHLDAAGLSSIFFAMPGVGGLSRYATSLAAQSLSHCEMLAVGVPEQTGLACVIYVDGAKHRRLLIGPEHAQIDRTRYADIRDQMLPYVTTTHGLFIDGYFIRRSISEGIADLDQMVSDGWKLHLELVPHTIWTDLNSADLDVLRRICSSISSSLSTVERVLDIERDTQLDGMERARKVASALMRLRMDGADLYLRWGGDNEAAKCLELSNEGNCVAWQYADAIWSVPRSAADRLHVREVTGTMPVDWRTEAARFRRSQ